MRDRQANLTPREREIVSLIGAGQDSRQIARSLGIAYFTVRKHRSNIQAKLEFAGAGRLSAYAAAVRLADAPRDPVLPPHGPP